MNTYVPYQTITKENKDGSLIVEAKASQFMEVIPSILRWIPFITVLQPDDLKAEIKDLVSNYLKKC